MRKISDMLREELSLNRGGDAEDSQSFAAVYKLRQERLAAMASKVVAIHACGAMGSGVMLDTQGHIATNAHVISTSRGICKQILVQPAHGRRAVARFLIGEYEQDIAIIKVEADQSYGGVEIAPEIFVGQDVYAIGHPLGNEHTVTRGIVSYLRRTVSERPYLQTDCSINPGNSGGGLFDELGRLVGLPTFKEVWADANKNVPVTNIGFAVPAAVVAEYYRRSQQRNLAVKCNGDPNAPRIPIIIS